MVDFYSHFIIHKLRNLVFQKNLKNFLLVIGNQNGLADQPMSPLKILILILGLSSWSDYVYVV